MDPKTATTEQLKAIGFDALRQINFYNKQLEIVNTELEARERTKKEVPETIKQRTHGQKDGGTVHGKK